MPVIRPVFRIGTTGGSLVSGRGRGRLPLPFDGTHGLPTDHVAKTLHVGGRMLGLVGLKLRLYPPLMVAARLKLAPHDFPGGPVIATGPVLRAVGNALRPVDDLPDRLDGWTGSGAA